jgi:hypothetical protein
MDRTTIRSRWVWATVLATVVFAILCMLDQHLKCDSQRATVNLQWKWTPDEVQEVINYWKNVEGKDRHLLMAGFCLGFDFLFMPLYGFAFFYATLAVREAFVPRAGWFRLTITGAAAIPLIGAACDACENSIQMMMLLNGPTDPLARAAYFATLAKSVCLAFGLVMTLLALVGLFRSK